ncbi:hypothetical protein [Sphingobacterium spiritivorum]|uniref:Uncharacterized protein n=2 Tax=Sphingobacterium spiritivorum TaxID=258 RepID=D7VTJ0_SPHSI|nr:hypothetical protein [Sphingobacterium spiritivorum]EFK57091.1 hypothetical protein HMPREF0766_14294 [Sphingobacterium spiritivorum ATCC 33861]QQT34911.1 hypothetical protein I6J01_16655 [Sphingobacterium spiritivorum]
MQMIFIIVGVMIITLVFLWKISGLGVKEETVAGDFYKANRDFLYSEKRELYIKKMIRRYQQLKWIITIIVLIIAFIPFFITVSDTLSFNGRLDAERYDARMRDSYILLVCMLGIGLLTCFFSWMIFKKTVQNYTKVIMELDNAHFEKMISVNNHLGLVNQFMMNAPFIIGYSNLYVFKLARILVLPWSEIKSIKITSAPRNGYYVRVKIKEKTYFFTVGEPQIVVILETEALKYNPDIEVRI